MRKILQKTDYIPHFEVRTLDGDVFSYAAIWQRRNLVLVTLPNTASDDSYASALKARGAEFDEYECVCVITRDRVPGVPAPGALVADRWGEIVHVAAGRELADLPTVSDLLEWLDYVARTCPECEGEAR